MQCHTGHCPRIFHPPGSLQSQHCVQPQSKRFCGLTFDTACIIDSDFITSASFLAFTTKEDFVCFAFYFWNGTPFRDLGVVMAKRTYPRCMHHCPSLLEVDKRRSFLERYWYKSVAFRIRRYRTFRASELKTCLVVRHDCRIGLCTLTRSTNAAILVFLGRFLDVDMTTQAESISTFHHVAVAICLRFACVVDVLWLL